MSAVATRVGICSWTFGATPLDEALERIARLGADGVELFGDTESSSAEATREALARHGLEPYSITPANVDIAHPRDGVRSGALEYYARLVEFAAALGRPVVSCHGFVSRHSAIATQSEELTLLVGAVREICDRAADRGLRVAFEVLNRYETHLVNTAEAAMTLVERVDRTNLGILLDSYHMNIEEPDPVTALHRTRDRLSLFHVADSNREGLGRGHADIEGQLQALRVIGYQGPIISDCTAPGPNPFTPDKGPGFVAELETHLSESIAWLHRSGLQQW